MSKRSVLSSILSARCPRCREGKLFTHEVLNGRKMSSMHKQCSNCGLTYEKEPGAFFGAMYVSYAISTGIFLVTSAVLYFFFDDPELKVYLITIPIVSLLLFPFNYRYSRVLFLYIIWKI